MFLIVDVENRTEMLNRIEQFLGWNSRGGNNESSALTKVRLHSIEYFVSPSKP